MQLRNPLVIASEKCGEVLRQVIFIDLGQRANNPEIQRNVLTQTVGFNADLYVSGVHVGMEKAVPKHLSEENSDAITRSLDMSTPASRNRST